MKKYNNLITSMENGILNLVIYRPSSLNALNLETMNELDSIFDEIQSSSEIRGVIISGDGEKSFVAGADINELANLTEDTGLKFALNGQRIFSKIENCSKPVIAAVNGFALGGGCELAMACHFRLAVKTAFFGQPEVNLGVIPGYGGTQRLTRLVGAGRAMELMMTGDHLKAEEAFRIGLINHLVDSREELLEEASLIMKKILAKAPRAISMIINTVNALHQNSEAFGIEANDFANCISTSDFKEGTRAFLEKRKPEFKGQ